MRKAPRSSTVHLRAIVAAALVLGLVLVVAASAWAALSVSIVPLPGDQTTVRTPSFTFAPDPNATTVECWIDQDAPTACSSPFTPASPLADGTHTLTVRVADDTEEQTADYTFSVDATPPMLSIDGGQAGPLSATPSLAFSVGGDATSVECWVDSGTPVDCTSPFSPATPLADGRHAFHVQASDALGNVATDDLDFSVDATPPALSIDGGQAGPLSAMPSLAFSVGGDARSVRCWVDSGTPVNCSSPFTPVTPLANGRHTFHVQASDALGNDATDQLDFSVDAVRPAVSVTSGPTITSSGTPSFEFTATDANLARVECSIDQGVEAYVSCRDAYTPAVPLSDGRYVFRVKATDSVGNVGSDSRQFTVDSAAPSLTIDSGPPLLTNQQLPSFGFTADVSATRVECWIDLGSPAACRSSFAPATPLADGRHTFHVRATDSLGNRAEDSQTFTVDTAPPSLSITLGPEGVTSDSTPLFGFAAERGATVECSIDQGTPAYGPCASATTYAAAAPLADGAYVFRVRATDPAGNTTTATRAFTVDTVPDAPAPTPGPAPVPRSTAPRLMSPFPLVRISGALTVGGARIRLLTVRAGRGAIVRVTVTPACAGKRRAPKGCRVLRAAGIVTRGDVIGFRSLARSYRSGTVIVVRVWRADQIGKYTRFTIVRGKAPRRVDQCLAPAATRGSRCPSD